MFLVFWFHSKINKRFENSFVRCCQATSNVPEEFESKQLKSASAKACACVFHADLQSENPKHTISGHLNPYILDKNIQKNIKHHQTLQRNFDFFYLDLFVRAPQALGQHSLRSPCGTQRVEASARLGHNDLLNGWFVVFVVSCGFIKSFHGCCALEGFCFNHLFSRASSVKFDKCSSLFGVSRMVFHSAVISNLLVKSVCFFGVGFERVSNTWSFLEVGSFQLMGALYPAGLVLWFRSG